MSEISIEELPKNLIEKYGTSISFDASNIILKSSNAETDISGLISFNVIDDVTRSLFLDWLNPDINGFGSKSRMSLTTNGKQIQIDFSAVKFHYNTGSITGTYLRIGK